jgi:hypothetical protein
MVNNPNRLGTIVGKQLFSGTAAPLADEQGMAIFPALS